MMKKSMMSGVSTYASGPTNNDGSIGGKAGMMRKSFNPKLKKSGVNVITSQKDDDSHS